MIASESKWRRRFLLLLLAWIVCTVATSFSSVRGILVAPLYLHHPNATGDIAYVMAGGVPYYERLHAASDLYHWDRVQKIYLLNEPESSSYNFVRQSSDTRLQRAIDFLAIRGVPPEAIESIPLASDGWLSSRVEAEGVAQLPQSFGSIVVVTSAPHTRRSKLCFDRAFGDEVAISVYSATTPAQSAEIHFPIWIEYAKLFVYSLFA